VILICNNFFFKRWNRWWLDKWTIWYDWSDKFIYLFFFIRLL